MKKMIFTLFLLQVLIINAISFIPNGVSIRYQTKSSQIESSVGIKSSGQQLNETYAILFAIPDNSDPFDKPFPDYAIKMKAHLIQYYGWNSSNILLLINENATLGNLTQSFSTIESKITINDMFLFYYIGHGAPLSPSFEVGKDGCWNATLGRFNYHQAVDSTLLKSYLDNLLCKSQIIILDQCHAGLFIYPPFGYASLTAKGRIVICSSEKEDQFPTHLFWITLGLPFSDYIFSAMEDILFRNSPIEDIFQRARWFFANDLYNQMCTKINPCRSNGIPGDINFNGYRTISVSEQEAMYNFIVDNLLTRFHDFVPNFEGKYITYAINSKISGKYGALSYNLELNYNLNVKILDRMNITEQITGHIMEIYRINTTISFPNYYGIIFPEYSVLEGINVSNGAHLINLNGSWYSTNLYSGSDNVYSIFNFPINLTISEVLWAGSISGLGLTFSIMPSKFTVIGSEEVKVMGRSLNTWKLTNSTYFTYPNISMQTTATYFIDRNTGVLAKFVSTGNYTLSMSGQTYSLMTDNKGEVIDTNFIFGGFSTTIEAVAGEWRHYMLDLFKADVKIKSNTVSGTISVDGSPIAPSQGSGSYISVWVLRLGGNSTDNMDVNITIVYNQTDLLKDGIDENKIGLYHRDEGSNQWTPVENYTIDMENNTVTFHYHGLCYFGLLIPNPAGSSSIGVPTTFILILLGLLSLVFLFRQCNKRNTKLYLF